MKFDMVLEEHDLEVVRQVERIPIIPSSILMMSYESYNCLLALTV
jgi:hypothetical protein